jgi:MFS superfamily sulfate permease-like transporter
VLLIPGVLNKIPLCSLAAILLVTGYKLARVSLFKSFYLKGWDQFLPFIITLVAILFTNLLNGIGVGMLVGIFFVIRSNFKSAVLLEKDGDHFLMQLRRDVSFLNKPLIKRRLGSLPAGVSLLIDARRADFIDKDIIEELNNFISNASRKNIRVDVKINENNPTHASLLRSNSNQAG